MCVTSSGHRGFASAGQFPEAVVLSVAIQNRLRAVETSFEQYSLHLALGIWETSRTNVTSITACFGAIYGSLLYCNILQLGLG